MRKPSIAVAALPAVGQAAERSLSEYAQGEIIEVSSLPIDFTRKQARFRSLPYRRRKRLPTPYGAVVLSQTCDIVQSDRVTVQVAPIVALNGEQAREAEGGRRPRYIAVPAAGVDRFGDLECMITIHKNDLVDISHRPGVQTHREGRNLAYAIGRRFTRFPFPDNLHPWLRPLEEILQERARKPQSPIGQVLARVKEIRVQAVGGWREPPYDLTILILVDEGELPYAAGDDRPPLPDDLGEYLRRSDGELKRTPGEIAASLLTATDPVRKYHLWLALGEAWAGVCRPRSASRAVLGEVESIEGEVVSESDLTVDRWRASEALDLDHLSSPRPG